MQIKEKLPEEQTDIHHSYIYPAIIRKPQRFLYSPVKVEDRTTLSSNLIKSWQSRHDEHEVAVLVENHVEAYGSFGQFTDPELLKKIPTNLTTPSGHPEWLFSDQRRKELGMMRVFLPYLINEAEKGHALARAMFSDPASLISPRIILFDNLHIGLSATTAVTNTDGEIYFDFPYLFDSVKEFLSQFHLVSAHEIFHNFRLQRQPVAIFNRAETFTHEALAYLLAHQLYMDDGQVEEDIDFWLPQAIQRCQSNPSFQSEAALKDIAQYSRKWRQAVGTRRFVQNALEFYAEDEDDPEETMREIFDEESGVFLKVARYVGYQLLQKGGLSAIQAVSSNSANKLLLMYNELGCMPKISDELLQGFK